MKRDSADDLELPFLEVTLAPNERPARLIVSRGPAYGRVGAILWVQQPDGRWTVLSRQARNGRPLPLHVGRDLQSGAIERVRAGLRGTVGSWRLVGTDDATEMRAILRSLALGLRRPAGDAPEVVGQRYLPFLDLLVPAGEEPEEAWVVECRNGDLWSAVVRIRRAPARRGDQRFRVFHRILIHQHDVPDVFPDLTEGEAARAVQVLVGKMISAASAAGCRPPRPAFGSEAIYRQLARLAVDLGRATPL
jgi:hypothetical protein